MTIREETQKLEEETLSRFAMRSARSAGRAREEAECDIRTPYQRDRDRILHSKSFRRLKGKTQVFLSPEGDHYRTRLTHTLEVSQISRTVGRALRLNEDLIEAIALGHDLGHTPFGHAGEAVLDSLAPGGFHHSAQSVRVVEKLEHGGKGLNLTREVIEGIRHHSKGLDTLSKVREKKPAGLSREAEVVALCDCVAYSNHDLDDAIRAQLVAPGEIPRGVSEILGKSYSPRLNTLVHDIVESSREREAICISATVEEGLETLRSFLLEKVYKREELLESFGRAKGVLESLFRFFQAKPEMIPADAVTREDKERGVCDYLAGMTDHYALAQFEKHFMPRPWLEED